MNNEPDEAKRKQMLKAIVDNDIETATSLLDAGFSANSLDSKGVSLLHEVVWMSAKAEMAHLIINRGARVDHVCKYQSTPLNAAVGWNTTMVEILLDAGADPNLEFKPGWNSLRYALGYKDRNDTPNAQAVLAASLLLDHGASLERFERSVGMTVLRFSVQEFNMNDSTQLPNWMEFHRGDEPAASASSWPVDLWGLSVSRTLPS